MDADWMCTPNTPAAENSTHHCQPQLIKLDDVSKIKVCRVLFLTALIISPLSAVRRRLTVSATTWPAAGGPLLAAPVQILLTRPATSSAVTGESGSDVRVNIHRDDGGNVRRPVREHHTATTMSSVVMQHFQFNNTPCFTREFNIYKPLSSSNCDVVGWPSADTRGSTGLTGLHCRRSEA